MGIREGVRQGGGVRSVCAVGELHGIRDEHLSVPEEMARAVREGGQAVGRGRSLTISREELCA